MKIVLAIDSFKECLNSKDIESIFADALISKGIDVTQLPMSDGGENMLEAFMTAIKGNIVKTDIHDPMMQQIKAEYGISDDGTAIIETAKACGLALIGIEKRNPMIASTYGVGELITHAIKQGCTKFIIGLGGSGTSDSGIGMLKALRDNFAKGGSIYDLADSPLSEHEFILASDVRNPLYGSNGAAKTFAAQKGATPDMIKELENMARQFAEHAAKKLGKDSSLCPGAGAAGGLGYAFMQFLNARVESGADLLLNLYGFDGIIKDADIIITGEGHSDLQTLMGKLPERVLRKGIKYGIPVWLVSGRVSDVESLHNAGFTFIGNITPNNTSDRNAVKPDVTKKNIIKWVGKHFK